MLIDFTENEIRALLWHIAAIDAAYGVEHPADRETASASHKLLEAIGLDSLAILGREC